MNRRIQICEYPYPMKMYESTRVRISYVRTEAFENWMEFCAIDKLRWWDFEDLILPLPAPFVGISL